MRPAGEWSVEEEGTHGGEVLGGPIVLDGVPGSVDGQHGVWEHVAVLAGDLPPLVVALAAKDKKGRVNAPQSGS